MMKVAALIFSVLATTSSAFVSNNGARVMTRLSMSDEVKTGTVKWFDTVKGFGFIVPDDGSSDVFVHQTAIKAEGFRSLADEESVEFRSEVDGNGRTKALDVTGPGGENVKGAPYNPDKSFDDW